MGKSNLLGGDDVAAEPKGRAIGALGPSDSSDSGSDMAGVSDDDGADPTVPVDVALRGEVPHGLLGSESPDTSVSDGAGTGERRSASSDAGVDGSDIGVDRVFVPGAKFDGEDPPDDEDPDLAFIDAIQADDMPVDEEGDEDDEDGQDRPRERKDDVVDPSARPIPALLRRPP